MANRHPARSRCMHLQVVPRCPGVCHLCANASQHLYMDTYAAKISWSQAATAAFALATDIAAPPLCTFALLEKGVGGCMLDSLASAVPSLWSRGTSQ